MSAKLNSRLRRARSVRRKISEKEISRLSVHRTPRHIYAQVISADGSQVVAAASSVEKELREQANGNIDAATRIGKAIAERAIKAGVKQVAFDRSGFRYHGRVKALADAARENGLEF